jgi:hypothetical protein
MKEHQHPVFTPVVAVNLPGNLNRSLQKNLAADLRASFGEPKAVRNFAHSFVIMDYRRRHVTPTLPAFCWFLSLACL